MTITTIPTFGADDEPRLNALGLSVDIFHNGLRAGASRAANRSPLALDSSPGVDVYHDGMENLHRMLKPLGWRLLQVDQQPRLVHPDGVASFTISSGINVGKSNMRTPRTRKKGPATRNSLAVPSPSPGLFEDLDAELAARFAEAARKAPFYFLLWERVSLASSGLLLEFSEPAGMTDGGSVNAWGDRIDVPFLALEGDLSVFGDLGDGDEYEVAVDPR